MSRPSPPWSAPSPSASAPAVPDDSGRLVQIRLELRSDMRRAGHVDGGWWPRSRDLRAELPGLLDALTERLGSDFGPVLRIGFGLEEWGPVGRGRLVMSTGRVAFGGFTTFASDIVWISGISTAHTPIVLLVVPPETPECRASTALQRAGTSGNTERPAELLEDRAAPFPTGASRDIDIAPAGA